MIMISTPEFLPLPFPYPPYAAPLDICGAFIKNIALSRKEYYRVYPCGRAADKWDPSTVQ